MTYIPHIMSSNSVSVFSSSGVKMFPNSHILFSEICDAVRAGNAKKLDKLIHTQNVSINGWDIKDDEVYYNGELLNNVAAQRLLEAKKGNFPLEPIKKFLENCKQNPHPHIVDKLYEFLETRGMPITEDGCFIAYKYCNSDYWDSHTGKTYQFLPGSHVEDPNRDNYCDNSGQECSEKGIHVGNFDYSGSKTKVVFVKVNPKDVLSVPHGEQAKKIRVWALDVMYDTDGKMYETPIVDNDGKEYEYVKGTDIYCDYKSEFGMVAVSGRIQNVGKVYIEIEKGASLTNQNGDKLTTTNKRRLMIKNITKTY